MGSIEHLWNYEPRSFSLGMLHHYQFLQPRDVEERGRMRRVHNLISDLGELMKHSVEIPLGLRTKKEFRLLDQQHQSLHIARA